MSSNSWAIFDNSHHKNDWGHKCIEIFFVDNQEPNPALGGELGEVP